MIRATIINNSDYVYSQVIDAGWEILARITAFFWQAVILALNVPNTGVRRKRTRDTSRTRTGGPKGSTYTVYPSPAQPPDAPRKRTGNLQRHVKPEYDKPNLTTRVGLMPGARYGLYLQLKGYDWLLATLKRVEPQIEAMIAGGGP